MPPQYFTYYSDGSYRDQAGSALLSLPTLANGETYLLQCTYLHLPGLAPLLTSHDYLGQKLAANPLAAEIEASWLKRSQQKYFLLTEKYSSQAYIASMPASSMPYNPQQPGYLLANRVIDADTALCQLQIPGTGSRDFQDLHFYREGGREYLRVLGQLMVEQAALPPLYAGARSYCTIQADGYARWYQVGAAAGRQLTVTLPEQGAIYVYDAEGACVLATWLTAERTVELPADGYIVCAGAAGQRFELNLQ